MSRSLNLWLLGIALICAASWYFGRDLLPSSSPATPAADQGPAGPQITDLDQAVQVRILNGTATSGLAREFSLLLPRAGCIPAGIGNAPDDRWDESLLVNRRLSTESARRLAGALGDLPVVTEWDDRVAEDVVLVLGEDHGRVKTALLDTPLPGAEAAGK